MRWRGYNTMPPEHPSRASGAAITHMAGSPEPTFIPHRSLVTVCYARFCSKHGGHDDDGRVSTWYSAGRYRPPLARVRQEKVQSRRDRAVGTTVVGEDPLGKYTCTICNSEEYMPRGT